MNKFKKIINLRRNLKNKIPSIGTWVQLNNSDSAELLAISGYNWIAVDFEHGNISINNAANIFRSIELNNSLPFARVSSHDIFECRKVLDIGALGLIIPNIQNDKQLERIIMHSSYPPVGKRGVGFCRANLYGLNFKEYMKFAQRPFIVAMIESIEGIENIENILKVQGLDAIFIGPYDLSASLKCVGDFENKEFKKTLEYVKKISIKNKIPIGIHVVNPDKKLLKNYINQGYTFIAYSMDTMFLTINSKI